MPCSARKSLITLVALAVFALAGCDSETVGSRIPTELDGAWQGSGLSEPSGEVRIPIELYLEDEDGQVSGTGSIAGMGRGTSRLTIDGTYGGDAALELVITDTLTGEYVEFAGWASSDEISGTLSGEPLIVDYDTNLRRLETP